MVVLYHSHRSLCSPFYRIMLLFLHSKEATIAPSRLQYTMLLSARHSNTIYYK